MHDVFITVPVAGRMASRRIDATFAACRATRYHTVLVGQPVNHAISVVEIALLCRVPTVFRSST